MHGIFGAVIRPANRIKHIPRMFDFSDVFQYFKFYFTPLPWPSDAGPPTLVGSDFESKLPDLDWTKY